MNKVTITKTDVIGNITTTKSVEYEFDSNADYTILEYLSDMLEKEDDE